MLQTVDVGERSLRTYRGVTPGPILDELARRAEGLRGARVLHVNATAFGGGVSELLRSIVPLLNDLGLVADWQVIGGDDEFFNVTKAMHNAFQGADTAPDSGQRRNYLENAERNAAELAGQQYDPRRRGRAVRRGEPAVASEPRGGSGAGGPWSGPHARALPAAQAAAQRVSLMLDLAGERPISRAAPTTGACRDPVCGMAIGERATTIEASHGERAYFFCSQACRARFEADAESYVRPLGAT